MLNKSRIMIHFISMHCLQGLHYKTLGVKREFQCYLVKAFVFSFLFMALTMASRVEYVSGLAAAHGDALLDWRIWGLRLSADKCKVTGKDNNPHSVALPCWSLLVSTTAWNTAVSFIFIFSYQEESQSLLWSFYYYYYALLCVSMLSAVGPSLVERLAKILCRSQRSHQGDAGTEESAHDLLTRKKLKHGSSSCGVQGVEPWPLVGLAR